MHAPRSMLAMAMLAGLLAAHPAVREHAVTRAAVDSCALGVDSVEHLTLPDGRTVHINLQSVATDGERIGVFGAPAFTWARGATNHANPLADSIIGAVIEPTQSHHTIPNPLAGRLVVDPRAATAAAGGWHVLFVNRVRDAGAPELVTLDSAVLWYGRFDGRAWHDVHRLTTLRNARIGTGLGSALTTDGDDVGFAYVFDVPMAKRRPPYNRPDQQGLVFIHGRPGRWRLDTLLTTFGPNAVGIVRTSRPHAWLVAIIMPYVDRASRVMASSLFLTTFENGWQPPTHVDGTALGALRGLGIWSGPDGAVVTWRADDPLQRQWLPVSETGRPLGSPSTLALNAQESAVTRLGDRTLAVTRDVAERDRHQLFVLRDGQANPIGHISAPNDVYGWALVPRSGSTLLLLASQIAMTPAQPPATTTITRIRVACSVRR